MKYFLDTEFIEGIQAKRIFGLPYVKIKNTIDLISIGIISEDKREYYAVSKDFNLKEAWNRFQWSKKNRFQTDGSSYQEEEYWIRENVLLPVFKEFLKLEEKSLIIQVRIISYASLLDQNFTYKNFKKLLKKYGKTNNEIAEEIKGFCSPYFIHGRNYTKPEFYAYYADYDWVVFCWLFGKMIDLPRGFPMYCIDLKQISDEKYKKYRATYFGDNEAESNESAVILNSIKDFTDYPDPKKYGEHNALGDAKWGLDFYNFLKKL